MLKLLCENFYALVGMLKLCTLCLGKGNARKYIFVIFIYDDRNLRALPFAVGDTSVNNAIFTTIFLYLHSDAGALLPVQK